VADVLRCPEVQALVGRYPAHYRRIGRALTACRTAALGGHVDECDQCGHRQISYNSCRNRHCPKCQASATAEWVEAQRAHLLPVPYCHVVFTLPQDVAMLALQNRRLLYGLLFQCASETLLELAADGRHLGARIGFLAILHTWGQKLELHPHLHCLVPAGGLSQERDAWVPCRPGFFLPVRVLSRLFRGKYVSALADAFRKGKLRLEGELAHFTDPVRFEDLIRQLRRREWVVYAKPPFGGPEVVVNYLARYTHRVAISNDRITGLADGRVTFDWKDYAHEHRTRSLTLEVVEFARRFLLHVLPERFVRIRYYGFLSNTCRQRELRICRELLNQAASAAERSAPAAQGIRQTVSDADGAEADTNVHQACPSCQTGKLRCVEILVHDTS
jgi:hypothetical protein